MESEIKQFSPEYITVGFIARRCGVSNTTVLRWIEKGELPAFRLPAGHYRIERENFADFLTSHGIPVPGMASKNRSRRRDS
jgi:excisionase family DNA binding protein